MGKNKVLLVAMFPPPYSSGERMLNLTIKTILEKENNVTSVNVSTGKLNPAKFGFPKIMNQVTSIWLYVKAIFIVRRMLRSTHFHALYFVTPGSSFGHIRDWLMVKAFYKIPYKYAFIQNGHVHEVFSKSWHKKITSLFINEVSAFVFTSKGLKEKAVTIPPQKGLVINNSIDPAVTFTNDEVEKKIKLHKPGKLKLLYLSNMNPTKGYMDLAQAIKIVHDKKTGCELTANFIGEWLSAEQESGFKEFLKTSGIENITTVHGKINDRSIIRDFLLEADVFILPTYFSHEAQPVSIIEALNAATPIVATAHASIPEYITDGYNGFLVGKQNPSQIAEALIKLMDPTCWEQIANNARASFKEGFSSEAYEHNIISLFNRDNRE